MDVQSANRSEDCLLDGEDHSAENQSSISRGEPNINAARYGGNESYHDKRLGSGREHGDGYGPGHGEDDEDSNAKSESDNRDSKNRISVSEAMIILGINPRMKMNERDLVRIWRCRMLDVHPDCACRCGLLQEQATA